MIAYIGARLPALTETFVYQELIAVRDCGIAIIPVSVYRPRRQCDEWALSNMEDVLVVWRWSRIVYGILECIVHPFVAARTLWRALGDSVNDPELTVKGRVSNVALAALAIGLAGELRKRNVGHLHAHMANTPTGIAMYASMQLGGTFSFTGHANDIMVSRAMLATKVRRAAFVVAISEWHRRLYTRGELLTERKVPIIHCGVDCNETRGAVEWDGTCRSEGCTRLLSVGRLVRKKGMDVLVRAVAMLTKEMPIVCDIVGDGPMRAQLEQMIDEHGLNARVRLLGAFSNEEVLREVQKCDVFVLACQRDAESGDQDGIPVSLMEAMAAGRCVVTTKLPPVTELVVDGVTGVCVEAGDAGALAMAIRRLAQDESLRNGLAMNGRAHVCEHFNRKKGAQQLAKCFREVQRQ